MRQALKHIRHGVIVVKAIDGIHDPRVVGSSLHITKDLVTILILAKTTVELAGKAVKTVTRSVHVRPSHSQSKIRVGERSIDDTALEARNITASEFRITAKSSLGVKEGRIDDVVLISVNRPVPV